MTENWKNAVGDPELCACLTLRRVQISRSTGRMTLTLTATRLIRRAERDEISRRLSMVFPTFPIELKISYPKADKADEAVRGYALERLFETIPGAQAFLRPEGWESSEEGLTIPVEADCGREFLNRAGAESELARILREDFLVETRVKFETRADVGEIARKITEDREREVARYLENAREETKKRERDVKARDKASIFGKEFHEPAFGMSDLTDDTGKCVLAGEVMSVTSIDAKKSDTKIVNFTFTDYTDSVTVKLFVNDRGNESVQDKAERLFAGLKEGAWVKARGDYRYDEYSHSMALFATDIMAMDAPERLDTAEEKRVELHLHTQMSAMDAIIPPADAIARAAKWGHKAIAITDHGVLQSFPEAFSAAKKNNIKFIPGCEGYLIEDSAELVRGADERALSKTRFAVVDVETTGLNPARDAIIEIGAVIVEGSVITREYTRLVNPNRPLPERITEITGITNAMLIGMPSFAEVAREFLDFVDGCVLVAHNAAFDIGCFKSSFQRLGMAFEFPYLDTLALFRNVYPKWKNHKLATVCKELGLINKNAHRAVDDARATAQAMLIGMTKMRESHPLELLSDFNRAFGGDSSDESFHIVILAASQTGMANLNRLVSEGHLNHFRRRPRWPRSIINKYREGLIVGSACEAGELFRAIVAGRPDSELLSIARFYDYLEIQPIANNFFMMDAGIVSTEEELRDFNRKVVFLGERLNKSVVATSDAHFMEPRDAIYRAILMASRGFDDVDKMTPLYFHTTDEMLQEFSYLGSAKAREVVITNPNKIADMVGKVRLFIEHPEGKDTFQPFWPEAADELKHIVEARAHEIYGETLPEIVRARIDKELGAIIGFGFATLYMIAVKLVRKSLSDGYIVGSRGSVGSSAVAFFSGITEVDSLPPHYVCPKCKHYEFDVPKQFACGYDLPEKLCPECGEIMDRDGFNIPFEVFLGFNGDKVPDIDLNFSGVYQPTAHNYVKELFGEANVFRAGTIGTVAEKTAYGYVLKYLEERGLTKSQAEKERLARGMIGVKRTTGQHPAGMVVLPQNYEIYQFTAIQHPADDMEADTVTTHFDFNSMHDVLVKLDILGHDDPTMLRDLQDLTGIAPSNVPLKNPEIFKSIISLFSGPEALGVTSDQIGVATGTLGIPEFGTGFVRGMLGETKPSSMEELVRISGLSHGTNVWLDNMQDIVKSGAAPLRECICTRDDIMNQLIDMGVPAKTAFDTMESVRKGRGLKPFMEEAIAAVEVPDWLVGSLKKIGYMFPKSHAAAYVTMALKIAFFKIYHPRAYYACYFKRNHESFNASTMVGGLEHLRAYRGELASLPKEERERKEGEIGLLDILIEMNARGITLAPADLYKSDTEKYLITEDGRIMPPLSAVPGVSLVQAQNLDAVRVEGEFISQEDMARRRVPKSVIEALRLGGLLTGIPESSQISLFD